MTIDVRDLFGPTSAELGVRRVAVVGAGVMGAGIAQALATSGFEVVCRDPDGAALDRAARLVSEGRYGFSRAVDAGLLARRPADDAHARLTFTTDLDSLADADLVIESVPEDPTLKRQVLAEIEAVVRPGTVLATNTSGLCINRLADALARPELLVGWHWASPAAVSPFAEVVRGVRTADYAVATVLAAARATGRDPVEVREDPERWGFVANRVFTAMLAEAHAVVEAGLCSADDLDTLMRDCFAWPAGPYEVLRGAATGWE